MLLGAGAQGRNRTTDTRIFSRTRDRFSIYINKLKRRNQSVLWIYCKSVLKLLHFYSYPIFFIR